MFNISKYKLISDWETSTGGKIARAKLGGKEYFLKKYGSPVCPSHSQVEKGTMTEKTYEKNRKIYEKFANYRNEVNTKLNELACPGGNIIAPVEWGTADTNFVEATEFIDGLLDLKSISSLDFVQKLLVLMTVIGAIRSVHKTGVVHGDIKPGNIVVAKSSTGHYVGKLIDFDCSFLTTIKPSGAGGDQVYMSPEICKCFVYEMDPSIVEQLTEKTDIFSLGVVFHEFLTGKTPPMGAIPRELSHKDPAKVYYCEYIYYGGEPSVSSSIGNTRLENLLERMLQLNPSKRPSASEILEELKAIKDGKASGYAKKSGESKTGAGAPAAAPVDKSVPAGFTTPWPEHNIEFVPSKIREFQYVSSKKAELSGKKIYHFYRENGNKYIYTLEKAINSGLAVYTSKTASASEGKAVPSGFATPWPEHNIEFVPSMAKKFQYVSSEKTEVDGKKVYAFYRKDGTRRLFTLETVINNGLAVKKH